MSREISPMVVRPVCSISARLKLTIGLKSASPIKHVAAARPPMLLLYADEDMAGLPAGAEAFAKALGKAKCEVTTKELKDRTHITIMTGMGKADDPTLASVREFVRKQTER